MRANLKKALFVIGVLLFVQVNSLPAQTIDIDLSKEFQVIRGFGGIHINSWTGQKMDRDFPEKAFDNDPGEIGLSIFRMSVDPNSSGWGAELPVAQYAISKGALVFASPWNPPSYMQKFREETEHGKDYTILPEHYGDYVTHLNNFVSYMNNNGVPLYAISVQNEPDWHGWTVWTANEMLTFLRDHAQNINCRVIAPESYNYSRNLINPLLNDPVVNSQIDILGTHLYGTRKEDFYYPLAYEKGKEIWMTEHLFGSGSLAENTWSLAMVLAEEINTCMDARMSAFVYWYIRRFYGLINDAGNITDKGYVMSHFSKFIRPGSYRVDVKFKPATNVTTTAYKTDSSVTVVVVNQNNKSVDFSFALLNTIPGVNSLTKFTTSASKKMVNDGTFALNNGNFSVSIDAKSITTFTSDARQGGKFGNLPPEASGGGDINILDTQGSDYPLTLKGSESTDPDGYIANYSWAKDGLHVSSLPDLDVSLGLGDHTYVLTVTDNDGATHADTVHVSIFNQNTVEVWLEAECTTTGANWNLLTNNNCSNSKYLTVKAGIEALSTPSNNTDDHLVYTFYLPESGKFKVWGRVLAPTPNDDSFWVRMDKGSWTNWNSIPGGSSWQWDDVHNQSNDSPMVYDLDTGSHTLTICFREDGAAIDKFYITNTGKIPSGLGGDATNCETNTGSSIGKNFGHPVQIFPNPASSYFRVESREPFKSLVIFDVHGRAVFKKRYASDVSSDEIPVTIEKGIYFLQLSGTQFSVFTGLIVGE